MNVIGDRVLKARQRRGITQRRVAEEIGTSASVSIEYLAGMVDDPRSAREMLAEIDTKSAEIRGMKEAYAETGDISISEIDTPAGAGAGAHDEKITGHMKFPMATEPRPAAGGVPGHPRER